MPYLRPMESCTKKPTGAQLTEKSNSSNVSPHSNRKKLIGVVIPPSTHSTSKKIPRWSSSKASKPSVPDIDLTASSDDENELDGDDEVVIVSQPRSTSTPSPATALQSTPTPSSSSPEFSLPPVTLFVREPSSEATLMSPPPEKRKRPLEPSLLNVHWRAGSRPIGRLPSYPPSSSRLSFRHSIGAASPPSPSPIRSPSPVRSPSPLRNTLSVGEITPPRTPSLRFTTPSSSASDPFIPRQQFRRSAAPSPPPLDRERPFSMSSAGGSDSPTRGRGLIQQTAGWRQKTPQEIWLEDEEDMRGYEGEAEGKGKGKGKEMEEEEEDDQLESDSENDKEGRGRAL